jgi:hypothetical protein
LLLLLGENFLKGFLSRTFERIQKLHLWPTGQKKVLLLTVKIKATDKSVVTLGFRQGGFCETHKETTHINATYKQRLIKALLAPTDVQYRGRWGLLK